MTDAEIHAAYASSPQAGLGDFPPMRDFSREPVIHVPGRSLGAELALSRLGQGDVTAAKVHELVLLVARSPLTVHETLARAGLARVNP